MFKRNKATWGGEDPIRRHDFGGIMSDDGALLRWLEDLV